MNWFIRKHVSTSNAMVAVHKKPMHQIIVYFTGNETLRKETRYLKLSIERRVKEEKLLKELRNIENQSG